MIYCPCFRRYKSLTVLIFFMLALSGCDLCGEEVLLRKTSGDHRVDFVVVQSDCGALSPYKERIYLVPTGKEVDEKYPVFVIDRSENLKVRWLENKILEVSYDSGRIYNYTNFWQSAELDFYEYIVEINLVQNKETLPLDAAVKEDSDRAVRKIARYGSI